MNRRQFVAPQPLLDIHTHYARDEDCPLVGLAGGVTEWSMPDQRARIRGRGSEARGWASQYGIIWIR